jgi:RNA polymerase-binding transcription factor DksA
MKKALTTSQRAQLEGLLVAQQRDLERRLAADLGAQGRAERAREDLLEGSGSGDDTAERESEREVDLVQAGLERAELAAVTGALRRLREPGFGHCVDCGVAIPFERLQVEPWALRCVPCQAAQERRG